MLSQELPGPATEEEEEEEAREQRRLGERTRRRRRRRMRSWSWSWGLPLQATLLVRAAGWLGTGSHGVRPDLDLDLDSERGLATLD